jgi:hypothetical protein
MTPPTRPAPLSSSTNFLHLLPTRPHHVVARVGSRHPDAGELPRRHHRPPHVSPPPLVTANGGAASPSSSRYPWLAASPPAEPSCHGRAATSGAAMVGAWPCSRKKPTHGAGLGLGLSGPHSPVVASQHARIRPSGRLLFFSFFIFF